TPQVQETNGPDSLPQIAKSEILHDAHNGHVEPAKSEPYPLSYRIVPTKGFCRGLVDDDLIGSDETAGIVRLMPEEPALGKMKPVSIREMLVRPQVGNAQNLVGRRPRGGKVQVVPIVAVG